MNNKPILGTLIIILALAALTGLALDLHLHAQAATAPAGTLVPLGTAQTDAGRQAAYTAVFQHLYGGGAARMATDAFAHDGTAYDAGTLLLPPGFDGVFAHAAVSGTQPFTPALALHGKPIAIFRCRLTDAHGLFYTSEAARYEGLLDADYLQGAGAYHDVLDETDVAAGALDDYSVLLLPAIKIGHAPDVADALGPAGLAAIRAFVENGGTLYAQSDGCYLAEAAGLVPAGTVDLDTRVTAYATDHVGQLNVLDRSRPLTWSWLDDTAYVLDDPVLAGGGNLTTIATYINVIVGGVSDADSDAILYQQFPGGGQVILMSGHPAADREHHYPQFLSALFQAFADKGDLTASMRQIFTTDPAVPDDLIPAREPDVPVLVTVSFENVSDVPLTGVVLTETVQAGFYLSGTLPLSPTVTPHDGGVDVVWTVDVVAPGHVFTVAFPAYTYLETMSRTQAIVAVGQATYRDTAIDQTVHLSHQPLVIRAEMSARLFGDRDIEPDRRFLIPKKGNLLDVYHTYENKEEGLAQNVRVVEIIPLVVPIVGLEDQTEFLEPNDGETIWITNEPFFYDEDYPRPVGLSEADWPAKTPISLITATQHLTGVQIVWITYTVPGGVHVDPPPEGKGYGNFITIPPTYSAYITVTPDFKLVVPALRLEWDLYDWPGYHYEEPAVRYGLRSRELLGRDVYFDETPRPDAVVIQYPGGSVYTLVGGDPVFYRQRLPTGEIVYWPEAGGASSHLAYEDRWGRTHSMPLRSAFYDVFDADSCFCGLGGPGELHIGLAATFEVRVDQDEDGAIEEHERVLEYPSKLPADVEWLVKTQGRLAISADETLLDIAIPRPYGTRIVPEGGTWGVEGVSYDVESGWATFESLTETHTLTHLFFRVASDGHTPTAIRLYGHIVPFEDYAPDNTAVKLAEGPFFTYHQTYAGPSRYEAIFCHVQGIRAHAKNVQLDKQVSPNLLSLHGDEFYYLLHVHDESFANRFLSDPYLASYGFDTLAATVYVGGREDMDILHSRVSPGEHTQIRIEVDNNSGITLTNVLITPDVSQLPPGVIVTPITGNEVPPQFPDLPFLNITTIPDAWRGNYYFRLEVGPDFPVDERGKALEIPFTITADGLPADFRLPPAMFGVPDGDGRVRNDFDRVDQLVVTDTFPAFVTVADVRIANYTETTTLTGLARDDRDAAARYFSATLRADVVLTSTGTAYTFTLTGPAATLPWDDAGATNGDLYLVVRATLPELTANRYQANAGFWFRFHEEEGRTWAAGPSNPTYINVHGAFVTTTYTVDGITHVFNGESLDELFPGEENLVTVTMTTVNVGDRLALDLTVTTTLPSTVTVVSASGAAGITPVIVDGQHIAWPIGNLREGATVTGEFTLQVTPPLSDTMATTNAPYVHPAAPILGLTTASHSRFVDEFSARLMRVYHEDRTAAAVSPTKLAAPLALRATWSGGEPVYLTWNGVDAPGVKYYIYRSTNSRTGYEWKNTTEGVTSQYDATAQWPQRYYYVVVARDEATGEGLHSNVAMVGRSPNDVFLPLVSKAP